MNDSIAPYTLEKLADEPIIIWSMWHTWQLRQHFQPLSDDLSCLLNQQTEYVYVIADIDASGATPKAEIEDIIWVTNEGTTGEKAITAHPNIRCWLIVTQDQGLRLVAQRVQSRRVNRVHLVIFDTLDEALAYARTH